MHQPIYSGNTFLPLKEDSLFIMDCMSTCSSAVQDSEGFHGCPGDSPHYISLLHVVCVRSCDSHETARSDL